MLDYSENRDTLILLGRPFLITAGAILNIGEGTMELNVGGKVMRYEVGKIAKFPQDEDESSEKFVAFC